MVHMARIGRTRNFFNVDLEDWHHCNFRGTLPEGHGPRVEGNTDRLLAMLERYGRPATFFCLGQVAREYPGLIKRIHHAGHEIASHGQAHELAYSQTPAQFRADVLESKERLEDLVGRPVVGYRAPSWSITTRNLWALEVLEELGFAYDSSIFPAANFLYGVAGAPRFPFVPRVGPRRLNLVEIPPSTLSFLGRRLGFGGGFYLRVLPLSVQLAAARFLNLRGHGAVVYIHPREIDAEQPRLALPLKERLIQYAGLGTTAAKLERFLETLEFMTMESYVLEAGGDLPAVAL